MKTAILKVLILGGTSFLGPHIVEELQDHGHEITLFHRGTQNPFPEIENLHGDRDGGLDVLKDRLWDVVIDTSGHLPRLVEDSAKVLSHSTKHYTFISTVGVYQDFLQQNIDETYPLARLEDESNEEITEKSYGALKALCEKVVANYFPRHLIIRPGLIVGPRDPTHRFAYWPLRLQEGGEILAPGSPDQLVQFIDVRDLAQWIVTMVEKQATGIYHTTGHAISFESLLKACAKNAHITWVSEDFLIQNQVQDWSELPLWLSYQRNMSGFLNVSIQKALSAGLKLRPLHETISAILEGEKPDVPIGLERNKEQELLKLWKQGFRN